MNTGQTNNTTSENIHPRNERSLGVLLLVLPPVLMALLYVVMQMINGAQAARSNAPNQGSMMTLFVVLAVGTIICVVAMAIGLAKIFRSTNK